MKPIKVNLTLIKQTPKQITDATAYIVRNCPDDADLILDAIDPPSTR